MAVKDLPDFAEYSMLFFGNEHQAKEKNMTTCRRSWSGVKAAAVQMFMTLRAEPGTEDNGAA